MRICHLSLGNSALAGRGGSVHSAGATINSYWQPTQMRHLSSSPTAVSPAPRMVSINALRGFVMFMMIFVNDLAGAGKVVPDAMVPIPATATAGAAA